jgi:hypothetical protein
MQVFTPKTAIGTVKNKGDIAWHLFTNAQVKTRVQITVNFEKRTENVLRAICNFENLTRGGSALASLIHRDYAYRPTVSYTSCLAPHMHYALVDVLSRVSEYTYLVQ